jgi:hypothetical protein
MDLLPRTAEDSARAIFATALSHALAKMTSVHRLFFFIFCFQIAHHHSVNKPRSTQTMPIIINLRRHFCIHRQTAYKSHRFPSHKRLKDNAPRQRDRQRGHNSAKKHLSEVKQPQNHTRTVGIEGLLLEQMFLFSHVMRKRSRGLDQKTNKRTTQTTVDEVDDRRSS